MNEQSELLNKIENAIKQKAFQQALDMALSGPDEKQFLFYRAVCYRYLNQFDEAMRSLDDLLQRYIDFGRGWQERAHNQFQLKDYSAAKESYLQAVKYNPALLASWQKLGLLAGHSNDTQLLNRVKNAVQYFQQLPDPLIAVTSMLHEGKLYKAESLCRSFLQQHKHHPEAMRLLAMIASELFILDDAEFLLESCLMVEPDNHTARFDYVSVLHKKQLYEKAWQQAKLLVEAAPDNPSFNNTWANQLAAIGEYQQAIDVYEQVKTDLSDSEHVSLAQGHAYKAIGEQQNAVTCYREAAAIREGFGDAWWSLANLKTWQFTEQDINEMHRLIDNAAMTPDDRIHLNFALGRAYESRSDYGRSFEFYKAGNEEKSRQLNYDADAMQRSFEQQKTVFNTPVRRDQLAGGCLSDEPIFIVGLPRAGSTLVEQILASHTQIDGTLELQSIMSIAHTLDGRKNLGEEGQYPAIVSTLSDDEKVKFGEKYLELAQIHRQDAPLFTDKMPNNFRHIGLIKTILPNARIIDVRRNPMDCCFSGFRQLFAQGQEFSYGLTDIARYYNDYVDLMNHWNTVFPDQIHTVIYETLVEDTENQVRALLDYLNLPFEDGCLAFHKNKRAVRTASSEQVRVPINKKGMGIAEKYKEHLGELKASLSSVH